MNRDQAKAIIHSVTGIPADAEGFALAMAWELGLNLIRACQTLDPDAFGDLVDEQLWKAD